MKKFSVVLISTVSLFTALPLMLMSQDMEPKGPCKADVEKFCKGVKKGNGRIVRCLKSHEAELSEPCKNRLNEQREKHREFNAACKEDAKKYCKDVKPGQGRMVHCLKKNQDSLAPACKKFFEKN